MSTFSVASTLHYPAPGLVEHRQKSDEGDFFERYPPVSAYINSEYSGRTVCQKQSKQIME